MATGVTQTGSGVSQIPVGALPIGTGVTPARKFVMQIVMATATAEVGMPPTGAEEMWIPELVTAKLPGALPRRIGGAPREKGVSPRWLGL